MNADYKILVTSGGTQEPIDRVRSITNHATGRLGAHIAEAFSKICEPNNLVYIHGPNAAVYNNGNRVIPVKTAQDLLDAAQRLLTTENFDAVIHSMAVSDYMSAGVSTPDGREIHRGEKIRSDERELFLRLVQTPKIIGRIKEWSPDTLLVGFKLLVGSTREELRAAAQSLMDKNHCDFVFANDLHDVKDASHKGFLLGKDGIMVDADNKNDIARLIFEAVTKALL